MNKILATLLILLPASVFGNNIHLLEEIELGHESECAPVRLDLPPGPLARSPVSIQAGFDNCWAHTAANLMNAWIGMNDVQKTSAAASPVALTFEYLKLTGIEQIHNSNSAIAVLRNAHLLEGCQIETLPDIKGNLKATSLFNELYLLYEKKDKISLSDSTRIINDNLASFGLITFKSELVEKLLTHPTRMKFLGAVEDEICKNSRIGYKGMPPPQVIRANDFGGLKKGTHAVKMFIDAQLNKKQPIPVGISYCDIRRTDRKFAAMDASGKIEINNKQYCPHGAHGGVIVGRRKVLFRTSESGPFLPENYICQYLVRDSGGTSCASYKDNQSLQPSDKCIEGQIWMEEDILLLNTSEAYYLPNRP